jgi:hypothetical protein
VVLLVADEAFGFVRVESEEGGWGELSGVGKVVTAPFTAPCTIIVPFVIQL